MLAAGRDADPRPEPSGRLTDAWRHCVGTGRFELALRRDYQDSLALIQREIGFRHIRGHGLLSDGVGVHRPYEYQGARQVRHAFTYVDQVVDAYLELGIRPFLELGFMPSGAGLRRPDRVLVAGQRHPAARPAPEWADLVRATLGAPGRPLRARRGARLADRGVERAQPHGVLGRAPTRTPTTGCTR